MNSYAVGSGFIPFFVGGMKACYMVEKNGQHFRVVDGCLALILQWAYRKVCGLFGWEREGRENNCGVLHVPFPNKSTPRHWIVTGIHGYNATEQFDAGMEYARRELMPKIDPELRWAAGSKPRNDPIPSIEEDGEDAFDLRGTILSEFKGQLSATTQHDH
jgi:hypothetical protein